MTREERLAEAGFKTGTIKDLLDLTDEDLQVVEIMVRVERKLWTALRKALGERDRWEKCAKNIELTYKEAEAENRRLREAMEDAVGEMRNSTGRNDPSWGDGYIDRYQLQDWVNRAADRLERALKVKDA